MNRLASIEARSLADAVRDELGADASALIARFRDGAPQREVRRGSGGTRFVISVGGEFDYADDPESFFYVWIYVTPVRRRPRLPAWVVRATASVVIDPTMGEVIN